MQLTIGKTLLYGRTARPLNDPYESNELNLPLADRYSAGVLDMGDKFSSQIPTSINFIVTSDVEVPFHVKNENICMS